MVKQTKVIMRRRKFLEVELPSLKSSIELLGNSNEELVNKNVKLDLTRYLKGKSVEGTFRVIIKDNKIFANPFKLKLMSYYIRRMIRKKISYVEDSFLTKSQESMLVVKPFLITRKKVSRAVRKTLRNKTRNWLEEYISERSDEEIFNDILANKLQKPLSLFLKKTYPLSLCEIRILEIKRPLNKEEIPEKKIKKGIGDKKKQIELEKEIEKVEKEKIKEAEEEIKKVQKKAVMKEKEIEMEDSKTKKKEKETKKKKIEDNKKNLNMKNKVKLA